MKRLTITLGCILCAGLVSAQLSTIPLKEASTPLDGCIYSLPKTLLSATVTFKQVRQAPGPYAQYAERFLGIGPVIQNEQTSHELIDVSLTARAVPDPAATFLVKPTEGKHPVTINLSPEGFLLGSNLTAESCKPKPSHDTVVDAAINSEAAHTQPSSILTRDMQQATSTAKLAELAAAQIFTIRDSRLSLLQQETEHTPADGRSFTLILEELNRMETYYTELFTGKKNSTILVKQVEFEPKREEEVVLFRFNQLNGLVDKNDLSGSPVSIKLSKMVIIDATSLKQRLEKKPSTPGLYYRIPCQTAITVFNSQKTFVQTMLSIPQLGSINILPAEMTKTIRLCPVTGSLIEAGR